MKKILYSKEKLSQLQQLTRLKSVNLHVDFADVCLESQDSSILFSTKIFLASTQNKTDEAIVTNFSITSKKVDSEEYQTFRNIKIGKVEEMYLVRTVLYFTDEKQISLPKRLAGVFKFFFYKYILRKQLSPRDGLLKGATKVHMECICNPHSKEAKDVDSKFRNLLDVGVVIRTSKGLIPIFSHNNGFGFFLLSKKPFYTEEELRRFSRNFYQFIKL